MPAGPVSWPYEVVAHDYEPNEQSDPDVFDLGGGGGRAEDLLETPETLITGERTVASVTFNSRANHEWLLLVRGTITGVAGDNLITRLYLGNVQIGPAHLHVGITLWPAPVCWWDTFWISGAAEHTAHVTVEQTGGGTGATAADFKLLCLDIGDTSSYTVPV